MTSALLRAFSIWMPYKGTYPQWFAVPEWRRLQLLPLGQNKGDWRHLQTCIPFIVSPKEGWLSQLPKKDERGKKSGTRKKSFFSCILHISFLQDFPVRSDSCSPEVHEQWHRPAQYICHTDVWRLLVTASSHWTYIAAMLQQAKEEDFCMNWGFIFRN